MSYAHAERQTFVYSSSISFPEPTYLLVSAKTRADQRHVGSGNEIDSTLAFIATKTGKAGELKRERTFGFMGKQIGEG